MGPRGPNFSQDDVQVRRYRCVILMDADRYSALYGRFMFNECQSRTQVPLVASCNIASSGIFRVKVSRKGLIIIL